MKFLWQIKKIMGRLWLRATIFCAAAVVTALLAIYFKQYIPEDISRKIGAEAVDSLLNIIASSMLAVTTFSLSTMVAAYSAATNNVTPRSTRLLLEDSTSQNALSTFIGAFLFSLVGIIALKIGIYGDSGRLILFVVTVVVIFLIILTLIRWIEYLSRLGRVSETINLVERATTRATKERIESPYLGGEVYDEKYNNLPDNAEKIYLDEIGYIQFIDMQALASFAEKEGTKIYVHVLPGTFVSPDRAVASIINVDPDIDRAKIRKALVTGGERSFDQDPRFGMIVLSEIASRALSPAVNDPGTAIDILGTSVRILSLWSAYRRDPDYKEKYKGVYVPPLAYADLFDDIFKPIARDGAAIREVAIRLQKSLAALHSKGDDEIRQAAAGISRYALDYNRKALTLPEDIAYIEQLAGQIKG